jgi:uncharacterized membrane protein YidH (DUF202 family)
MKIDDSNKDCNNNRPIGSGILVLIFGVVFFLSGSFYLITEKPVTIEKDLLLKIFLIVIGLLLIIWAIERLKNNTGEWFKVGRNTIEFLIAVVSAIVAIMALIN